MSAQQKQENKIMGEKIAKVREVVRNFNKTQIALALHHFDLNVEKTIQAFVHGTYQEALGDWEQTGNGSAKNKNGKKKKSKSTKVAVDNGSSTSGKSTPAVPAKLAAESVVKTVVASNVATTALTPATATVFNGATAQKDDKTAKASGLEAKQNNSHSGNGVSKKSKKSKRSGVLAEVSADELARFQALDDSGKLNAIAAEASQLNSYVAELDELEKLFNNQLSLSQNALMQCILEIKQCLSERERQLSADLTRCRDQASTLFNSRRAKLIELSCKTITPPKAVQEREALFKALKGFNAAKAQDKTIANATHLHTDYSKICDAIAQFGEVVPTIPTADITDEKIAPKSTVSAAAAPASNNQTTQQPLDLNSYTNGYEKISPLSHVSVVSDMSDVNQVNQKVEEKKVTQVASSGIFMQSDGLSADEMAQIQKQIEETLRAKGIDPSILSEMSMNTIAPRKRPQHKNAGDKRGNAGGKTQQQASHPKLSILS